MLDRLTLDQLRVLVAVAEAGSFSAAARRLRRVQSAVSTAMANLEAQLDLAIWDRRGRTPVLTDRGRAVLAQARRVLDEVDGLRRVVGELERGVEPLVSLCVEAVFPVDALAELCRGFARAFPTVELRVEVETMSAVAARVLDGSATLGVATPTPAAQALERRALAPIRMVPVVARSHPLARVRGPLATDQLADHVQIVLSERASAGAAAMPDRAVLSSRTWRVADLHTKRALLCAGLGWGNLPAHLIAADLRRRRLVAIRPAAWAVDEHTVPLAAVYRRDAAFGPAHRWVLERLPGLCARSS